MTTLGRRTPKKPKPPAAGRKAASPNPGGQPDGREPAAKTNATVRTTAITAVASVVVALVGAVAVSFPAFCGIKGWCDAKAAAPASPSAPTPSAPTPSAPPAQPSATPPVGDTPTTAKNRIDGVDAAPGRTTQPVGTPPRRAGAAPPAESPEPARAAGGRTVTKSLVVTSSVYIDVDSDEIPANDTGTADDDFQIEPGAITRHGNARFAPQGHDSTCTVVAQDAVKKLVGEGPFCGTSGDTLRPRRFVLTFTKSTAAGNYEVAVTYLN